LEILVLGLMAVHHESLEEEHHELEVDRARQRQKGERKDRTYLLPRRRPPPLPSTSMAQCFVIDYIHLDASEGVGNSSTPSLPTPASESPSTPTCSLPGPAGSPPTPTTTSDHYVTCRGRMLDKSHICASTYLFI